MHSFFKAFTFFAALTFGCATTASATPHVSDLRFSGLKYPNSKAEGEKPVLSSVLGPGQGQDLGALPGFSELLPFVLPSPDQEEAGSCLYMSLTGVAEWWLARLSPREPRVSEGPLDLSERHLMNLAGIEESGNGVANWKTDSIRLFNARQEGWRNRSYRFTKGWYRDSASGYVPAAPNSAGAAYDTSYNWIDGTSTAGQIEKVRLPNFSPNVLFADPESNQWNVGVMPSEITQRVKNLLQRNRAPVHVIYNHYGYWHAVFIVGYDDAGDTQGCPFVKGARAYYPEEVADLKKELAETVDQSRRETLLARIAKFETTIRKLDRSIAARGECNARGVFYVRDSIYGVAGEPLYDYDRSRTGEESPYSKPIIYREYRWLEHFANHATQILVTSAGENL